MSIRCKRVYFSWPTFVLNSKCFLFCWLCWDPEGEFFCLVKDIFVDVGTVGFAVGLVLSADCVIHCGEIQILVCCVFLCLLVPLGKLLVVNER